MTTAELQTIFNSTDISGNQLVMEGGQLFLILSSDKRRRNIGEIKRHMPDGNLLFFKNEKESNKFLRTNSWSLPYDVIKNVTYIIIKTERFIYKITKENALKYGSFLWFKSSGYERKIYVPIQNWIKEVAP